MGAPFAVLRASPIIGLAPFTFCPGKRRKRLKTQGLIYILARITGAETRTEEHTSELQSLMRISYADFCLKKKITIKIPIHITYHSVNHNITQLTTHFTCLPYTTTSSLYTKHR